ncbi:MAG: alanyl-tRNA editing protein [Eubacteriales bacterium]|nr:alanyl-tRNA editing protein [Eubacteriales bacterium]
MTQKLFYDNLYQREFDAHIVRQDIQNGQAFVVLDRTLLYPGGGGQPCDLGTLNGCPVASVHEQNGEIVHVLEKPLPEGNVHGVLDWPRRFELMQQHLGQHILSAVFVRDCGLNTIALRMEQNALSIDLDGYAKEDMVTRAEAAANDVIYENIPVETLLPDMEEIRRNSKRAIPQTDEAIRIVRIGDLDYTPCCGLQNSATGEVGMIKIQRIETHKSGSRIHFLCGRPALRWAVALCGSAAYLMRELNCGEAGLSERVMKLRSETQELKQQRQTLLNRLSATESVELLKSAPRVGEIAIVMHTMQDTTQDEMKQLYACLTEQKGVAVLLGGKTPAGAFLMFGCSKGEKRIDVRPAFKDAIDMIGGKGGGGASYAQGFGANAAQLSTAIKVAGEIIEKQLSERTGGTK